MSRYVVGASVAIKWFVPESRSAAAGRLLEGEHELLAPDLAVIEFGALLSKKIRLGEISDNEARDILAGLHAIPLRIEQCTNLLDLAFEVGDDLELDFYDSIYLAMAIRTASPLVTADRELHEALRGGPYDKNIVWVEDVP
jgi:predicted nucleic acid-binding protein